jgi:hypothetical protein
VSSYILVVVATVAQVIALAWFIASHIPGGIGGMTAMSGFAMRAAAGMFTARG